MMKEPGDKCVLPHNTTTYAASAVVCLGVVLSYVPQLLRIVTKRSSVGISPWFLFLGTTSSACATLNVVTLQWHLIECCRKMPLFSALEQLMGMLQTFLQQLMFTLVYVAAVATYASFVLFLAYYRVHQKHRRQALKNGRRAARRTAADARETERLQPPEQSGHDSSESESDIESIHTHIHQRYGATDAPGGTANATDSSLAEHARRDEQAYKRHVPAPMRRILEQYHMPGEDDLSGKAGTLFEWRLACALAWIAAAQLVGTVAYTVYVLGTKQPRHIREHWGAVLGVAGMLLAMFQYLPQIAHTARARLVRSLSIPTMCVQVPGSLLFIYALAERDGINWSSLLPYVVAAVLQGVLLVLCIVWKLRQRRLGVDDYGRSVDPAW